MRFVVPMSLALLALVLATPSSAASVSPRDRAAIDALLDHFVPDVVEGKNLKEGWALTAGSARTSSYRQWLRGDTSVQRYPAKGTRFHGWSVTYALPGDVGFDILLQPSKPTLGAWSFRAEAEKIGGRWRITTWYPVAQFAPQGQRAAVNGPNDLGPSNGPSLSTKARLSGWILLAPLGFVGLVGLLLAAVATVRWARRRGRVRAVERDLARS